MALWTNKTRLPKDDIRNFAGISCPGLCHLSYRQGENILPRGRNPTVIPTKKAATLQNATDGFHQSAGKDLNSGPLE